MFDWMSALFAELHGHVFQTAVLPVLHAIGIGGYAELAFDATEFFLIGAIEVTALAIVLGSLERWYPLEQQEESEKKVDVLYTLLQRLGFVPLLGLALMDLGVIGSDLPANRDWLDARLLVPAGDAAALARVWGGLVGDESRAQAAGADNAARIARDGDRRVQMDAVNRLYRNLLAGKGGA